MDGMRTPAIPRPAATILLLREDPFEVLMVRRHPDQHFASALVFPGGLVDESDRSDDWLPLLYDAERFTPEQRALRIAAFRETFEESALLLARTENGRAVACPTGHHADFLSLVGASGGRLYLDDLSHFGRWITPEPAAKRFDTHFFLAIAPSDQEAICDGGEAVELEWTTPSAVLDRAQAGERSILFPTQMNLKLLSRSADAQRAIAEARTRTVVTVIPRMEKREGGVAVIIPVEAGYGVTEHLHPRAPKALGGE